MTRSLPCVALAAFFATGSSASGQPNPLDSWVDACHVTSPDLQALLANEALLVSASALEDNDDGTYHLLEQPFTTGIGAFGVPHDLCSTARFYGQDQVRAPFTTRSAVQVGPDLVLTAWHNVFDPGHVGFYRVVFGLQYQNVLGSCVPPDFGRIPADQVYDVQEVVADGKVSDDVDMLLLRLDRVVGDVYPRVRRSGSGWPGESMTMIGHPESMSAKVDLDAVAGSVGDWHGKEAIKVANLHGLDRSSGSMVYNRARGVLETVNASGRGVNFVLSASGPGVCYVLEHEPGFFERNASLRYFAHHIPAFELLVRSLDPVVYVTPVGGTLANPTTTRRVGAPPTAAGSIDYQIVPPGPAAPGAPTLTITPAAPLTGSLAPGQGFSIQQDAEIDGVTACGVQERSYEVRDLTHGFSDIARHVFEIGLREFAVTPERPGIIQDLALPLDGTTVYKLSNPRPDPVTVVVTADQPWVTLSTDASEGGPSLEVTLQPHESDKEVVIGVAGLTAPKPDPYHYEATVTFGFAPGTPCPGSGATTRHVTFTFGREIFMVEQVVPIPDGTSSVIVEVQVPETFCIDDVNAIVKTSVVPASQILVQLMSPAPLEQWLTLWDHGRVEVPLDVTFDDDGAGTVPVELLGAFDGQQGEGAWLFQVVDDRPGIAGTLDKWGLEFKAEPCP